MRTKLGLELIFPCAFPLAVDIINPCDAIGLDIDYPMVTYIAPVAMKPQHIPACRIVGKLQELAPMPVKPVLVKGYRITIFLSQSSRPYC